jgi:hypothetical protein
VDEDPLGAARGLLIGTLVSVPLWVLVVGGAVALFWW